MSTELPRAVIQPAELITEYIKLRDAKKAWEEKLKEAMHLQYIGPMEAIEEALRATSASWAWIA